MSEPVDIETPEHAASRGKLNLAQRITIAAVILGMCPTVGGTLWMVFGITRDTQELRRDVDRLTAKIAVMDERGTNASRNGIYQESEFSHATERRVATLEKTLGEMAPKLERIDVNLQWMMKQQQTQKTP